jgi:hypothetical protein
MGRFGCWGTIYWAFPMNCFLRPGLPDKYLKENELTHEKNPENSLDMAGGFF